MSIRSSANASYRSQQAAPIEFKSEYSTTNHDDTVGHILSRLDQLQASISTQPDSVVAPLTERPARLVASKADPSDLHARLQHLEAIHEDTLHQLGAKLSLVEKKVRDNREAEHLMTQISSKFGQIETRLQAQTRLHDRVCDLETRMQPDPEQERILARINSKLDAIERRKATLGAPYEEKRSIAAPYESSAPRYSDPERAEYLQKRIEKLQALRSRYEDEDD